MYKSKIIIALVILVSLFCVTSSNAGYYCDKVCALPISWLHQLICAPCLAKDAVDMATTITKGVIDTRSERLSDEAYDKATAHKELESLLVSLHNDCTKELADGGEYRIVSKQVKMDNHELYYVLTCFNGKDKRRLCVQKKNTETGESEENCEDITAAVSDKDKEGTEKTAPEKDKTDNKNEKGEAI